MVFESSVIRASEALPGRQEPMPLENRHFVHGGVLKPPFPPGTATILFGMGCFWGAERRLWQQQGVVTTAVGYAGGVTPNPTYKEVCSGRTGHTEVVQVVYEDSPEVLAHLLKVFWEAHDPTQGMRQGNDRGTQYRSAIYVFSDAQWRAAQDSRAHYQGQLSAAGCRPITTEIARDVPLYYAEDYHQQYLAKNPNGYCGLAGTGVCF